MLRWLSTGPVTLRRSHRLWAQHEPVEELVCGLCLKGSEVRSLRLGNGDIHGSSVLLRGNEVFLVGTRIPVVDRGFYGSHEACRERKLLLTRSQIRHFVSKSLQEGLELLPAKIFFNDRGLVKVQVVAARRKPPPDKRRKLLDQNSRAEVTATCS